MKRIASLLSLLVLVCALPACNSVWDDTSASAEGTPYAKPVKAQTIIVDWSKNSQLALLLDGNKTLFLTNGSKTTHYVLLLKQDARGGHRVTWPANVQWASGHAPQLNAAPSTENYIFLDYDGTYYTASLSNKKAP